MKVKVSTVLANWPYFYPRDTFTVIKAEEHMSLLETDTGARQWVGNSFLLNADGSEFDASALYASPSKQEPVAVTDEMVERVRQLEEACNAARTALAGMTSVQGAIDKLDCRPLGVAAALSQTQGE